MAIVIRVAARCRLARWTAASLRRGEKLDHNLRSRSTYSGLHAAGVAHAVGCGAGLAIKARSCTSATFGAVPAVSGKMGVAFRRRVPGTMVRFDADEDGVGARSRFSDVVSVASGAAMLCRRSRARGLR